MADAKREATGRAGDSGLVEALRAEAARQVQATSEKDILAKLRADGITTLEQLVSMTLKDVKEGLLSPGHVAKDTFIYTQAVYKKEMPIPDHLAQQYGIKR